MKNALIIIILVILIIFGLYVIDLTENVEAPAPPTTEENGEDELATVSDGKIVFSYPENFGLAVTEEQVLVSSYIPPCNPSFDYCIYYNGNEYENTNFDSAGLRIEKRSELLDVNTCLQTPPDGYSNLEILTNSEANYSTSLFPEIGDAGAGHYSQGNLYRLFYDETCYEFETRIGESQFENYETGTIERFTDGNRAGVLNNLKEILLNISLSKTDEKIIFP